MKRFATIVALAAGLAGAAIAQPAVTDHVTPGGLAFRYAEMPEGQSQSLEFGWKDGRALAIPGRAGLISFGPRLMMQGPVGMTRGEFFEDAKDLQARWHLGGSTHFVTGGLSAPPESFEAAVELFGRTLAEPALRPAHIDEMKKRLAAGLRQSASSPGVMASHIAGHLTLPPGPLKDWVLSERAIYDAVEGADIDAWRRAALVREGLMIAAAGPLPAAEAGWLIDRLFAPLPARGEPAPAPDPDVMTPPTRTIIREADVAQTLLQVSGWTGYRNDGELVRGRLAMRILQKRLFDAIRGRLGAAYGASAGLGAALPDRYSITLSSSVAHDRAAVALAAMREIYRVFLAEGVSEAEVAPMRIRMISEAEEAFRRPSAVASAVLGAMLNGLPPDHFGNALRRIGDIGAAAINADLREKLAGRPLTTIVVAPSAQPFQADCVVKAAAEVLTACR